MNFLQSIFNAIWSTARAIQSAARWAHNKYSSQVQAAVNPYGSCFSHCACWFLQNGAPGKFDALTPDDVSREINGQAYQDYTRNTSGLGAWALARYQGRLNELWAVQVKYINDKLRAGGIIGVAVFDQATTVDKIKTALVGGAVIVGTSPVYKGQRLGHIMLIVGYDPGEGVWLVDDPFGSFVDGYASGHIGKGDDIKVPVGDFEKIRTSLSIHF